MARAKKKIHVALTKQGAHWVAAATEDASLSVGAHNTRRARHLLQSMIKDKYGEVDIEFEISLPGEERAALEKHLAEERMLQQLVESLPASRVAIAERLLSIHLTQQEVAEMLGLSQGHLAVILKREATSATPVKPSTRRTTNR